MLDSSLLGNDRNIIDVQISPTEPPKPRSASSLLGNDQNEIDVTLPQEADDSREKHREAVANARALRREAAAAKTTEVRKKAVADAKAIFVAAERTINRVSDSTRNAAERTRSKRNAAKALEQSQKAALELLPDMRESIPKESADVLPKGGISRRKFEAHRKAVQQHAAKQFAADTKSGRKIVRQLRRESERTWKSSASAYAAKMALPHTERIIGIANISICAVLVSCIAVGMVALERPTVSEIENRNLATMPDFSVASYLSGEYTAGVTDYYDDTVPYRSTFKNMTAAFRKYFGIQNDDDVVLHGTLIPVQEALPAVTTTAQTTTTPIHDAAAPPIPIDETATTVTTAAATTETTAETAPPTEDGGEEGGELSNNILIYKKRAISLYGGSFTRGEGYAQTLSKYQMQLGENVKVYSLVAPTPCSFYTPDDFKRMIGSETDNIQHINENLVNVTPVDAYRALLPHVDEPIYMRTDHHWSALGAFYAAEEFAATARVPFAPISEYDRVSREGYVGTMYGYSGDITLKNNPEEFFFYQPHAQFTTTYYNRALGNKREGKLLMNIDTLGAPINWYLVYLGGDDRVTHVHTEVPNSRRLVVFKDSYGNALIPWLTASFEDIYVVDIRYFRKNAIRYIKDVGATDVLFAMNTFSATGGNSKQIEKIRKQ